MQKTQIIILILVLIFELKTLKTYNIYSNRINQNSLQKNVINKIPKKVLKTMFKVIFKYLIYYNLVF